MTASDASRDVALPDEMIAHTAGPGRTCIAVIGIDRYRAWNRLYNAVNDAKGALKLFAHLGFELVGAPLFDEMATGDALRQLVTDDLADLGMEDNLVLFFAGHGHTVTRTFYGGTSVKDGYIIPVDGDRPGGRVGTWLHLESWLTQITRIPAKHILVVLDACHSGLALGPIIQWRSRGMETHRSEPLEHLRARRSRRIITSALDDQLAMDAGPVPGHSLFTGCLIEAMSGGLVATTGQRVVTGSEIGHYVQRRVSEYPRSVQTPDFGALELDDRGELLVRIAIDPAPPDPESRCLVNSSQLSTIEAHIESDIADQLLASEPSSESAARPILKATTATSPRLGGNDQPAPQLNAVVPQTISLTPGAAHISVVATTLGGAVAGDFATSHVAQRGKRFVSRLSAIGIAAGVTTILIIVIASRFGNVGPVGQREAVLTGDENLDVGHSVIGASSDASILDASIPDPNIGTGTALDRGQTLKGEATTRNDRKLERANEPSAKPTLRGQRAMKPESPQPARGHRKPPSGSPDTTPAPGPVTTAGNPEQVSVPQPAILPSDDSKVTRTPEHVSIPAPSDPYVSMPAPRSSSDSSLRQIRPRASDPYEADRLNEEGKMLVRGGAYAEAAAKLSRAAALAPWEPKYVFNLCVARTSEGLFDDAREACKRVMTLHPDAELAAKTDRMLDKIKELCRSTGLQCRED